MLIFVLSVRIFRSTLFNSKWPISSWIQDSYLNLFYVWKVKMLVFLDVITNPSTYLFVPFFRIPVHLTKELTLDWQHTFSGKTRKVTWLWINFWNSKDNYKMRFCVWNLIANLQEAIQSQKKPLLNCSLPMLDFQVFSRIFLIIFRFHEIFQSILNFMHTCP